MDCQSCIDHRRQSSRTLVCLHITERLQAGAVTIVELAAEMVRPWRHLGLKQRAVGLAKRLSGFHFEDQLHIAICEAKFYKHSYGFRPNRSAHHAVARAMFLVNIKHYQYVVDIDIKGSFDNVDHGKLLKQLWTLGIRDKQLISILSKMLKAPIQGEGVPPKGVPQGGILSPLLANVVLNELDWWIASQWENFPKLIRYRSRPHFKGNGTLKHVYLVRYADDFKLFCKVRGEPLRRRGGKMTAWGWIVPDKF